MTRAVLEGVAFGLRDGLDQMIAAGMPAPSQVRASGGGTASPLWRQILADVLGAELATVSTTEGAAYGAGHAGGGRGRLVRVRGGAAAGRWSRVTPGGVTGRRMSSGMPRRTRVPRALPGARADVPSGRGGARAPAPQRSSR